MGANLVAADLTRANLRESNLQVALLAGSNLSKARLRHANLGATVFLQSNLWNTDFSKANLRWAVFAGVDLSSAQGLETTTHVEPSTIGIDTIYRSGGKIPEVFLRGCGVPDEIIELSRSLLEKKSKYFKCFISHSGKDKRFCERLRADLQVNNVPNYYFPEDAKWGETVWGEIDRSIKIYDKLIVVLSENSLQSGPVSREIERALNREDTEHKNVLFPITLDRYVFDTWEHERKADVLRKVVGDFSGWNKDAAKYEKAFNKLLKGLQAEG